MEFVVLSEQEFSNICDSFNGNSFYQSVPWALIKSKNGWISYYVGVKKKNRIVACSLILGRKLFLNYYLYYAPRGMLLDYNDNELLSFFVQNIKSFLKKKNGVVFKIDPLVEYQKHDKDGQIIGNDSTRDVVNNLHNLGFKHHGFSVGYTDELQFRWSYGLNIDVSMDELFKNMDQRCRRCIRKYEKYPLEIVSVNNENIQDFKGVMEHTAKRQNHFDRSTEYYMNLETYFGDRSKLVIIYLDRDKFISDFKDDKLFDIVQNDDRKKIPVSAGVFIFDKSRANYVYGGTYRDYMPLMAQYKLQMEMISLAKKKQIPLYDFGGISGDFTPGTENYGVYEFKRGFGGYVIEYIGEFDLVLNKIGYNMYYGGYGIYRGFKHFLAKFKK